MNILNNDKINVLKKRMNFFHDIIKTSSMYLDDSKKIMSNMSLNGDSLDKKFSQITSYFNYDISKLKLEKEANEKIKSFLNDMINLHMHVKKRPTFETQERIDECYANKKKVLDLINSQDLLFQI